MRHRLAMWLLAVLALSSGFATGQEAKKPLTTPASIHAQQPGSLPAGFDSLFDFRRFPPLAGWTAENDGEVSIVNVVPFGPPDHVLIDPRAGWVRTEATFDHFTLRFDARLDDDHTRALLVFAGSTTSDGVIMGYTIPIPIGDPYIHPTIRGAELTLLNFQKKILSKPGEWKTYEVRYQPAGLRDHITVLLDGQPVGDTYFQMQKSPEPATPSDVLLGRHAGWVAFHTMNGPIRLRNAYINRTTQQLR